jgi:drug/metabolite transporter (DMT)-like permease
MRSRSAPVAALVAMVLIWGYSWVVMKVALRYAHPFDFAMLRVGVGTVLLFALVRLQRRPMRLARYRMALLLGTLQVALFVALTHFALLYAGPGKTSVLVFTMPFWMIVFAHYLIGERMRGAEWAAVALSRGWC